jgi:hypothetical protein
LVLLKPLPAGQVKPALLGTGMPGLDSWQSKPSRVPVPVQWLPQETSFSPAFFTHFPLRHCVSLAQKQPPWVAQVLDAPLQLPKGQVKPLPMETGQPPSGQSRGVPPSTTVVPEQTPPEHATPAPHAAPHPPQLALSVM